MIPATLSHPSGSLHDALEPWCAVGATGMLRLFPPPGGAIYLTGGQISYAECPPACGLDRLLTASGRLSAEAWRAALATGRANRRVGETLVRQGLLAPAELESLVLAALYGAAHFLFEMDHGHSRFEMGTGHVIGPVVALDLRTMCAEVDRRRRLLADTWPDSKLDSHAVLPARRLPGHHVALTARQWEIVANADRRRTPVELARSLGRDTFATLLEVRRLARAGLVEPGRPGTVSPSGGGQARARDLPADDRPSDAIHDSATPEDGPGTADAPGGTERGDPASPTPSTSPRPPTGSTGPTGPTGSADKPHPADPAGGEGDDGEQRGDEPSSRGAPLPRRVARTGTWIPGQGGQLRAGSGARARSGNGPDGADRPEPPPMDEICPESALVRIRDALEALR